MFFRQQNPVLGDVDFDGVLFPSLGVSYQTPKYWQRLHFEAALLLLSGQFQWNSPDVAISSSNFLWSRFAINGFYAAYQFEAGQRQVDVDFHFGFSHMQTPIFSTAEPSLLAINDISQMQTQLGLEARTHLHHNWSYFLRTSFASPLSSSSNVIAVRPEFSYVIDAQVGANYQLNEKWFFGSSLKSSLVNFNERFTGLGSDNTSGRRDIQYYSFEGRLGLAF